MARLREGFVSNVSHENCGRRSRDGRTTPRGTLARGATARLSLAPGSTVVVINRSGEAARLDVRITGDTNLGIGYVAAEAAADAARSDSARSDG